MNGARFLGGRSFSSDNKKPAERWALAPEASICTCADNDQRATAADWATNSAKKIAAFFDLDGILIPSPSLEWRFVSYLLSRDEISRSTLARWLLRCLKDWLRAPWGIARASKSYLAGLRASLVDDWQLSLERVTIESAALPMFAACAQRIRSHLAQSHAVVFVSGTLDPLARVVARRFARDCERSAGIDANAAVNQIEIRATRLESLEDRWTGFLASDHISGEAKARAVRDLAASRSFDLSRSFAYGDQIADLPMLAAVGHPVAVNPSSRLARAARQRGWPTCEWRALETSAFAHASQTPYTNAAPHIQSSHAPRFSPRPTL